MNDKKKDLLRQVSSESKKLQNQLKSLSAANVWKEILKNNPTEELNKSLQENTLFTQKLPPSIDEVMPSLPEIQPIRSMEEVISELLIKHREIESAENYAKTTFELITEFNNSLEQEFETGLVLVNYDNNLVLNIRSIAYRNPSIIIFQGENSATSDPIELVQHISQVNILFTKIKRQEPSKPKNPIGFIWENDTKTS